VLSQSKVVEIVSGNQREASILNKEHVVVHRDTISDT
jgi:hypothetical protein